MGRRSKQYPHSQRVFMACVCFFHMEHQLHTRRIASSGIGPCTMDFSPRNTALLLYGVDRADFSCGAVWLDICSGQNHYGSKSPIFNRFAGGARVVHHLAVTACAATYRPPRVGGFVGILYPPKNNRGITNAPTPGNLSKIIVSGVEPCSRATRSRPVDLEKRAAFRPVGTGYRIRGRTLLGHPSSFSGS